jgi:hypothetical protein
MNRARDWTAALVGAATGILLISCKGKSEKSEAGTPPPATLVPAPEAVVYTEPFSSPEGQAWLNSRYRMDTHFANDPELAWENVASEEGNEYPVARLGCTNQYGKPDHCHLLVINSTPTRLLSVTPGSKAKAYDINLITEGENPKKAYMSCKDVEEVGGNDQRVAGDCKIFPPRPEDNMDPSHAFCAHTERDNDNKVVIWFEFGHGACSLTSGPIHNGTGHTHPNKNKK